MPKQHVRVSFNPDVKILDVTTENRGVISTSLEHDFDVIADLATEEVPTKVVGLQVMNPSEYLPLGIYGYDDQANTLTFGSKQGATDVKTNGDLVAYWAPDPYDPNDYTLLGVEVLSARKWLTNAINIPSPLAGEG